MRIYPYVDMTRANADGSYPVYIVVKNHAGRFFVNAGMTTTDRLVGRTFPKSDKNGKVKTTLLCKYLTDTEALCMMSEMTEVDNKHLKARIQQEVLGVKPKERYKFLSDFIREFADAKKASTRSIYMLTANKVAQYDDRATLDNCSAEWLESFRAHFKSLGMGTNGIGKELRNIRAVFNWARRKGYTKNYPFADYHIVEQETTPNNIPVEVLRRLRDFPCESWQKPYVDFFFLSLYLAGMNAVDLLSLKADAIKDGHISFIRRKTDKEGATKVRTITIPVVREAQEIIDRYPSREGWLLSFMDCRTSYRSFTHACGDALKKVGPSWKVKDKMGKLRKVEYAPICPNITLYSSRYSFGSIAANDLDISERTIGMCLGHSWTKNVTARYMAGDQKKIDAAVMRVVGYIAGTGVP